MASHKQSESLIKKLGWTALGVGAFVAANAIYKALTKYKLEDKVVLITGGSRGLGLVLARELCKKGARLAICARSTDQLSKAQEELEQEGAQVLALTADITKQQDVEEMIQTVIAHYGRLDVLVNNAGIIQVGPQETMKVKEYEDAMKTHFWGPLYAMLAAIPNFLRQGEGRIVNVTSIGGKVAVPHLLPYTASKFALVGLSEGMHNELKKDNIRVTTVVPNLMQTGSPRNITVKGDHDAEYAWFKLSGSSPLLSQRAEVAAKNIIEAIEYGESEAILSFTAKAATILQGIAPGWMSTILSLANTLLPRNVHGGDQSKKGYESESSLTHGPIGSISDEAARRNNEN